MSKVSGKIRRMERTLDQMEKNSAITNIYLKRNNRYMKTIHQHLVGDGKGRKGIFKRLGTLEIRQKGILAVASVVCSAIIIGVVKSLF